MNLETGVFVDTEFEQDSGDATGIVRDVVTGAPIGVSYGGILPRQEYFDEQVAVLQRSVDKALPDVSNQIVSLSTDRRHVLVYSSDTTVSAAYYYWNRDAKSFDFIGESMPNLPFASL
jgi:hypothetical protein